VNQRSLYHTGRGEGRQGSELMEFRTDGLWWVGNECGGEKVEKYQRKNIRNFIHPKSG
jgi:hypothetical protein